MAKTVPADHIKQIHGKVSKESAGYYYTGKLDNKQFYRTRDESYHKHHSPLQKWNSAAFAFAALEWQRLVNEPNGREQLEQEFQNSDKCKPNGVKAQTARAWKYSHLKHFWKSEHPFDAWYAEQTENLQERTQQLAGNDPTKRQILQQIQKLQQQIDQLNNQLKNLPS